MYNFETVIGSQTEKPADIDTTSSQYVVYIRKNVRGYEKRDDQDKVIFQGWKYEECVVPKNDYIVDKILELSQENLLLKGQNEALKSQVEELEGKVTGLQDKVTEDNLTSMMGMTDMYEILLTMQEV